MEMDFQYSEHCKEMIRERNILIEWVEEVINNPDWQILGKDNNLHLYKRIEEKGGKILHLVINKDVNPKKIITAYFDRKARRQR